MNTYEATGKTAGGNDFKMPVEAEDEDEALETAEEQLPEECDIQSVTAE